MTSAMMTAKELRRVLGYDPETGKFWWKVSKNQIRVGSAAGSLDNGYIRIKIQGHLYKASRLAWLYTHGRWPTKNIDHINRDRTDDRIVNLRQVTKTQNMGNTSLVCRNTSGVRGVCWSPRLSKFQAAITTNGKRNYLGIFSDLGEAKAAYDRAAKKHYGQFYNSGER